MTAAAPLVQGPRAPDNSQAGNAVARVMICDDSIVVRNAITKMLEADPGIRVVARAAQGQAALVELQRQTIDVIILDIEMPVMDGLTALPLLLRQDPGVKVIMASTLTSRGADVAIRALQLGAADYVPKPSTASINDDSFRRELVAKVRGLARLRQRTRASAATQIITAPPYELRPASHARPDLLAIGAPPAGPRRSSA